MGEGAQHMDGPPPSAQSRSSGRRTVTNRSLLFGVFLSAVGTFLVVPRPTLPRVVPLPQVDHEQIRHTALLERRRAREVRDGSLSRQGRLVGELVRRLGRAEVTNVQLNELRTRLQRTVRRVLDQGKKEDLLSLRALQSELFLIAVRHYVQSGRQSPMLLELGGGFLSTAQGSWLTEDGVLLEDDELRLLFRVRWGRITGTHRQSGFGPSLEEFRRYYSIYLRYPEGALTEPPEATALRRARYAEALGDMDPEYPARLAVGMCLLRAHRYAQAREHLLAHLEQHPNGQWALAAQNYLRLAEDAL